MLICSICGEDIDEKGQDNVSLMVGCPICEDCSQDVRYDRLVNDDDEVY